MVGVRFQVGFDDLKAKLAQLQGHEGKASMVKSLREPMKELFVHLLKLLSEESFDKPLTDAQTEVLGVLVSFLPDKDPSLGMFDITMCMSTAISVVEQIEGILAGPEARLFDYNNDKLKLLLSEHAKLQDKLENAQGNGYSEACITVVGAVVARVRALAMLRRTADLGVLDEGVDSACGKIDAEFFESFPADTPWPPTIEDPEWPAVVEHATATLQEMDGAKLQQCLGVAGAKVREYKSVLELYKGVCEDETEVFKGAKVSFIKGHTLMAEGC